MTCDSCSLTLRVLELQLELAVRENMNKLLTRHIYLLQKERDEIRKNGEILLEAEKKKSARLTALTSDCREYIRQPRDLHRDDQMIEEVNRHIGEQMI